MALASAGVRLSQQELAEKLGTNETVGTTLRALSELLQSAGFLALRRNEASFHDIAAALQEGKIVIVGYIEPHEETPHYAIVSSYQGGTLNLIDPWLGENVTMAESEFAARWKDDANQTYGNRAMLTLARSHARRV